jgi:GNAT superfamily N-acetyltransferase
MIVAEYEPTRSSFDNDLLPLLNRFYLRGHEDGFFLHEQRAAYEYCLENSHVEFWPLAMRDGDQLVGHAAVIRDERLEPGTAFFGFLEFVDDPAVFEELWRSVREVARTKRVARLMGPANGSIWHQYRCVKESSAEPPFLTEPRTPLHYYDFLNAAGPSNEIGYSSAVRHSYERMLALMESKAGEIEESIREQDCEVTVERSVSIPTLREIVALSDEVFRERSWGYTPLDATDFLKLYAGMRDSRGLHAVILLRRGGSLIGYAITLRDGEKMICKTICLKPEFQSRGLGNAIALHLHRLAREDGMSSILYVLVRDRNQIYNFPMQDIEIFRRYAAFEYEV